MPATRTVRHRDPWRYLDGTIRVRFGFAMDALMSQPAYRCTRSCQTFTPFEQAQARKTNNAVL